MKGVKTVAMLSFFIANISVGSVSCTAPTARLSTSGSIPIHAWIGPPAEETTVERYRELRSAGFTHSFSGFPNVEAMAAALEIAQATDIKLFVNTPELKEDPEGTVQRFREHPALAGYYLMDEPNAKDFPDLAAWVNRIRAVDDDHFCYINLFPNYATSEQLGTATYQEHVDRFVAEVPVQVISFDYYPIVGYVRPYWYENLEIIAQAARTVGKPFWAFALATAHGPYPIPTLAHLRLQVFSNLAYGAQGIQYFTYWTPTGTVWDFHGGPIDAHGKRTVVYDRVKAVNAEIQGLASVFLGSRVVQVGHTGDTLPPGTERFAPSPPITSLTTGGSGAVVSLLEKDNSRFLVIVNRDIEQAMPLTVTLASPLEASWVDKNGAAHKILGRTHGMDIGPGDIAVLTWKQR